MGRRAADDDTTDLDVAAEDAEDALPATRGDARDVLDILCKSFASERGLEVG